jgi:hypothetical protein
MAPVVAPVVAPAPVRIRRWSVGVGIGSLDLAPHQSPESKSEFSIGQIAVRYLATRHLEIELAIGGGREQVEDPYNGERYEGDREVSQGVLALRYRFSPQRKWNWWLMAGLGSLAVTQVEAAEEEKDAAQQSTLQFGIGLERRWTRFALQLELRAVGVAPVEDEMSGDIKPQPEPVRPESGQMLPPGEPVPPLEPTVTRDGWSGGQLTLSANYYF